MPLWGIPTWWRYAPRRVNCPEHGVVVEHLPWNEGKARSLACRESHQDRLRRNASKTSGCSSFALQFPLENGAIGLLRATRWDHGQDRTTASQIPQTSRPE